MSSTEWTGGPNIYGWVRTGVAGDKTYEMYVWCIRRRWLWKITTGARASEVSGEALSRDLAMKSADAALEVLREDHS